MTHYEILGLNGGASADEIKSAYQKKSQECPVEDQAAIKQAYEVLIDPTSRDMYDTYLVQLDELREEVKYQHYVQKEEENQLNDGTLLSRWQKLYRIDLRDYKSLSKQDRITKIYAKLFFRSFTGIVGVILVTLYLIYAGAVVNFFTFIMNSSDAYIVRFILLGTFLGFFVSSKLYGNIYRRWKMSSRSE